MPQFSQVSLARLDTCHPDLQRVFREVVKYHDCTVLQGHRGKDDQNAAYAAGRSQLRWPHSKHNSEPSIAVDVAPWFSSGIPWGDDFNAALATARSELHAALLTGVESDRARKLLSAAKLAEYRRAENLETWHLFAGVVLGTAHQLGVRLRWGGDWDGRWLRLQEFDDLPHYELIEGAP